MNFKEKECITKTYKSSSGKVCSTAFDCLLEDIVFFKKQRETGKIKSDYELFEMIEDYKEYCSEIKKEKVLKLHSEELPPNSLVDICNGIIN